MKKVAHILSTIKKQKLPKYVIFFDTETKETIESETRRRLTLKLGYAILTRRSENRGFQEVSRRSFTSNAEFHRWIDAECVGKERYYLVAHNIAFDLRITGTMRYLARKGWKRTGLIVDGIKFLATYRKGDTTIQMLNNQQLFASSLKQLGESIGEYKGQVNFATASDEELLSYCKQDVEVMRKAWNAWIGFLADNDLGPFRMTAASQSFAAYRYRFMDTELFIHNDQRTIDLERESYHGGRTEVFFKGRWKGGNVYNCDINSMYPYVMKHKLMPVKLRKYYPQLSLDTFETFRASYGYIVEATIAIDTPSVPAIVEGRLCFPTGFVRGVFAKPELEYALSIGSLVEVHRGAVYDEALIFSEFVDFFYTARKKFKAEGNSAFSFVSKLLLNSLYGKFGQKADVWKVIGHASKHEDGYYKAMNMWTKQVEKIRIIDGIVEKAIGTEEGLNSFVAIASYVTSEARVLLDQMIAEAGRENVLYCDTDSLFLTQEGYHNLAAFMHEDQLGKLKVVGVSDDVEIYGPKWYRFGEHVKSKGIRKDAKPLGDRTFEQDRFQSFNGALSSHDLDGVVIDRVHKTLSMQYLKGIEMPDGRIVPFSLSPADPALPSL